MKYVSDKYKGDPYGMIVVPTGVRFDDMVGLKGDKEIGELPTSTMKTSSAKAGT